MPDRDTTRAWLLPGPVRRFREHLRAIRQLADETQAHVLENRRYVIEAHAELAQAAARIEARLRQLADRVEAGMEAEATQHEQLIEVLRFIRSRGDEQRRRLHELRADPSYELPYGEPEPLVSVLMRTYQDHELMRERAIPSVLAQTYQNFEIVVVGDAAPEEARVAVESFGDPRMRFWNRPYRGPYPDDPESRWRVVGVPPYNDGIHLARGLWIALLDADDAFRPEHLERLLAHAREKRLELAYARVRVRAGENRPSRPTPGIPDTETVGRFPPEHGQFMLQSALCHHGLARIFEADLADAPLGLPQDWAVCLRMMEAGVLIGMIDAETVDYYPATARSPVQRSSRVRGSRSRLDVGDLAVRNGQRRQGPVKLFTSALDDVKLLPHFLRHYVRAGIADFYIAAPSELASEIAPLQADYRITLHTTERSEMDESCRRSALAANHTDPMRERHQDNDEWVVIVDLDEFIDFDDESVEGTIAAAEAEGANVVQGIMYDRFSEDGQPVDVEPDADLAKLFPVRWRFARDIKRADDHKAVLVKGLLRAAPVAEHHRMIGERASDTVLTIDHYRWTAGSIEMLRERSQRFREAGSPWWIEYERALEHYETYGHFAWERFGGELILPERERVP
jgi:glycosyltransferase involved in cell wall biosynthesis